MKTYCFEFGATDAGGGYNRLRTCTIEANSLEEAIEIAEEAAALRAAIPQVNLVILLDEKSEVVWMKALTE